MDIWTLFQIYTKSLLKKVSNGDCVPTAFICILLDFSLLQTFDFFRILVYQKSDQMWELSFWIPIMISSVAHFSNLLLILLFHFWRHKTLLKLFTYWLAYSLISLMWPLWVNDTFWRLYWCHSGVWVYLLQTWLVWLWWVMILPGDLTDVTLVSEDAF